MRVFVTETWEVAMMMMFCEGAEFCECGEEKRKLG